MLPSFAAWLNVAGLIDFAGALGTGVLTSNTALGLLADGVPRASLGTLPLSLVPTFAVPLWTVFHLISLIQLRRRHRAGAGARSRRGILQNRSCVATVIGQRTTRSRG